MGINSISEEDEEWIKGESPAKVEETLREGELRERDF